MKFLVRFYIFAAESQQLAFEGEKKNSKKERKKRKKINKIFRRV